MDDSKEIMESERSKMQKELDEGNKKKDEELQTMKEERDYATKELKDIKNE